MATDALRTGRGSSARRSGVIARLTTETKHAFKTTEFWAMLAIIAGILLASWIVGQGDGNGNANADAFPAQRAWLYVAIVGVGYMVSRGLAKAGSRSRTGQMRMICLAAAAANNCQAVRRSEVASYVRRLRRPSRGARTQGRRHRGAVTHGIPQSRRF
jgi:hypothetical protein